MYVLSLATFLAGLLLLVFSMLHGVERPAASTHASAASSRLPMFGAFATVFGATAYLLLRYTTLGAPAASMVAVLAGALGALGALVVVARWAVPGALADPVDERYLLQGHFAVVTGAIGVDAIGEIRYDDAGIPRSAVARAVDGSPLAPDTEVVIDRVVDGIAYVEPWSLVEQRI
jgi:hypothetical protein